MTNKRISPDELNKRVIDCYRRRCAGESFSQIVKQLSAEYGVTERQAANYLRKADKLLADIKKNIRAEVEFGLAYQRLSTLYKLNIEAEDYKAAFAVQKELNELTGLKDGKQRLEVDLKGFTITVIDKKTKTELANLKE